MKKPRFSKQLTLNDLGLTGSNQAGVCVPRRNRELLDFLPELDSGRENPSVLIDCLDRDGGLWRFRYVYYNGKLTGNSTRNEYRITRMTEFFRKWNAKKGSALVISGTEKQDFYQIEIEGPADAKSGLDKIDGSKVITLKSWRKIH